MRRSLILLLALAVLSAGVIAAAVPYVNQNAETVTYTEQRRYGDPAAGEGLQIQSLLAYDGRMHWDNTITLGPEIENHCEFRFTSDYTTVEAASSAWLDVYCQGNLGMSSNGPIDFTDNRETAWLADVLTAAAEQTPNDVENYSVTVHLADYLSYYEILADGINVGWYLGEVPQFWDTITEFFHVPVQEGDVAEIEISKDAYGNVYSVSYNLMDVANIYGNGIKGPDGCWYLLFTAQDGDGNPLEGAAPQGIYRIPVQELTYGPDALEQVVESQVELVYATDYSGNLYAMEDNTRLLLLADTSDGQEAVLFDWATMELLQTIPTGGHYTGNEGGLYNTQVENDHLVTISQCQKEGEDSYTGQWTAVWALDDDGLLEKVVDCDTTAAMEDSFAFSSSFFDGERFLRVSYVDPYLDGSLNVQLCDSQGLQYAAMLEVNLRESPFSNRIIQTETSRPAVGLAGDR